jgi:hypothetical protein
MGFDTVLGSRCVVADETLDHDMMSSSISLGGGEIKWIGTPSMITHTLMIAPAIGELRR